MVPIDLLNDSGPALAIGLEHPGEPCLVRVAADECSACGGDCRHVAIAKRLEGSAPAQITRLLFGTRFSFGPAKGKAVAVRLLEQVAVVGFSAWGSNTDARRYTVRLEGNVCSRCRQPGCVVFGRDWEAYAPFWRPQVLLETSQRMQGSVRDRESMIILYEQVRLEFQEVVHSLEPSAVAWTLNWELLIEEGSLSVRATTAARAGSSRPVRTASCGS